MAINANAALIVDSTALCYDIIFGADLLDICCFHLDYKHNIVCWMEHKLSLGNIHNF